MKGRYRFIFRHSVTVLMLSASAARRRLPSNRSKGPLDHHAFLFLQIECVVSSTPTCLLRDFRRQLPYPNAWPIGENDRPLHRVLELADVSRPPVIHQGRHGLGRHRRHVLFHA